MSIDNRTVTIARWIGRILSVLLLWLMIVLAIGHINSNGTDNRVGNHIVCAKPEHLREMMLGSALFTILVGLILAWKWEGFGSLLILGGFTVFAIVNGSRTLVLSPCNPFFAFLIAGLLFLFCWWKTRKTS